jgi:hypothetical protein
MGMVLLQTLGLLAVAFVAWLPFWWVAPHIDERLQDPGLRWPASAALALVAFLTFINLAGRLVEHSTIVAGTYFLVCALATLVILVRAMVRGTRGTRIPPLRRWLPVIGIAILLAVPQVFQAVSSNRWDEAASSAIHLTAPNQFAEGVFPPRHNAFPDVAIKYHYGFILLPGAIRWVTGWSSNHAVDIASTGLWLFSFLLLFAWLRAMNFGRLAAYWAGFAALLGGGFAWMYLGRLSVYEGYQKQPELSTLVHEYDRSEGWFRNLLSAFEHQNIHLANRAGEIFPLPFDVAVHYQQHAVALGIALAIAAAFFFWLWQTDPRRRWTWLLINVFSFGVLLLGHSVFGGVSAVTAGLTLGILWLRRREGQAFIQAGLFTIGVTVVAFAHGGMLTPGAIYGPPGAPLALRDVPGYLAGGLLDLLHWSLAAWGFLLLFSMLAIVVAWRQRKVLDGSGLYLLYFGIFALFSFAVPQAAFFSHAGGIEEQTEVSKFFFCTHLALAAISAFGVDWISRRWTPWLLLPVFPMTLVTPVASSIAAGLDEKGHWVGIYKSPYDWSGGQALKAAATAFYELKTGPRDQYFVLSGQESASAYVNEMLIYGGSTFTVSPTRYEVTGFGFLIAESIAKARIAQESDIARLLPGSMERAGVNWLYGDQIFDLAIRPASVRSRFRKLLADVAITPRYVSESRQLFELTGPSDGVDNGISAHWTPTVVQPAKADWTGDGVTDPVFQDLDERVLLLEGAQVLSLDSPPSSDRIPLVMLGSITDPAGVDVLVGVMADAWYQRGASVSEMVRQHSWIWKRQDPEQKTTTRPFQYGFWNFPVDVPVLGDHDGDGLESLIIHRPNTGDWYVSGVGAVDGASLPARRGALPVVANFLPGPESELAVWSPLNGQFRLRHDRVREAYEFGGLEGDVLVPADYDGDGLDELAIWQPSTGLWWMRNIPEATVWSVSYGESHEIPVPADYDGDGRTDFAVWNREERTIRVSFDEGTTTGMVIDVPENAIPAWVRMY